MKYSRLSTRMVPSSLQDWLEEELENRGIDGVVYTRYILSLLQDDESNDEVTVNSGLCGSTLEENPNFINCCVHHNKRQHKCHSNKWVHRRYQQSSSVNGSWQKNKMLKCCECVYDECSRLTNIDQKRSVVVECLKSASEQDFEIEALVDELCAKLKEYKYSMVRSQMDSQPIDSRSADSCHELNSSPKEQAKRYYAAFPALNTTNVFESAKPVTEIPVDLNLHRVRLDNNFGPLEQRSKWDGRRIIEFAKKKDCSLEASDSSVDEELSESRQSRRLTSFGLTEKIRNPIEDITNVYNESNIYKVTSGSVGKTSNIDLRFTNADRFSHSENVVPISADFTEKERLKCVFENEIAHNDEWEHEKLKVLVSKFNNKVASLWNDEKSVRNVRKSIWCFDTNWSPQSSSTPSPKLNECIKNKWISIAPFEESSALWEPLQKHTVSYSLASATLETDVDDWFSGDKHDKFSPKVVFENKTSLSNHGDDSLFVEVPSRRNGSLSEIGDSEKQNTSNEYYLPVHEAPEKEDETSECLLTSPKTHFQPIKQDSFDEEYEDATTYEADAEVSRLVPCSSICPNNANNDLKCDNKSRSSQESKSRSLSTSLPELTLFMGPFTDNELEEDKLSIEEERHSSKACVDCEHENTKAASVSSNEENEFEELCTMLNEVLRDETNSKPFVNKVEANWFTEKEETVITSEQNASWSRFWDSSNRDFYPLNGVNSDKAAVHADEEFLIDSNVNDDVNIAAFPLDKFEENESLMNEKSLEWFAENQNEYLTLPSESYDTNVEWSAGVEYEYTNVVSEDNSDPSSVFCCWNLEKEWQKEENDSVTSQQRKVMDDCNGKRPCTFFMEGNCRRSDCKFSHDLRSITCKFWEEGCCFKGFLCPFLHGYPSVDSKNRKSNVGNPKYMIESEADFPSLSTGNSEAYLSESSESNVSPAKSKGKRFKQESNVLYRMVKKKRKKAGHQCYNEKAV
ncbi:uncharacterized protein B4U80_13625 [Leptotrombidium deliense]|uniref:C3H1-type domain-containing protein n=1 Tax=Leptotrombidium deliense TaxID=299467 RepID=A0A443SRZ9_9ACAR|nr:uncharacterized protein B4U80_13625 [Leptotrombidium deliense]